VAGLFVDTLLDPELVDLVAFLSDLGTYMAAVLTGLAIHAAITLPLLLYFVARRSPMAYARSLAPALMTAFSTASSSATYPVTRECVTNNAGVSDESADFVLPLGATINMDGTALYEAVAAVFIANALGFTLTFGQQIVIMLTATLAAVGAAGVPSAGLVTMIIVLESVGLPAAGYGLVVAVDRLLDMCRTTVNVWGDSVGAAVVDNTG
jgi:Na+/H+-dicarboxylate symporter